MTRYYPPFFHFNPSHYSCINHPTASPPQKTDTENTSCNSKNKYIVEILGIKLYQDDILILLLICFLYSQNSNDLLLYILLFSLIIS